MTAVSRKDVATLAGVSPAVVSYVLNGGPRPVASSTRARVLAAVERLGYRPNGIARSLRINRTMTLGLVVPDASNPFFAELARGVEEAAFATGHTLLVGNATEDQQRQSAYVRTFLQQQVDGLLLVPVHGAVACLDELRRSERPWVVLDRRVEWVDDVPQVLVDNRGGARQATLHLVEHGRRRIGCIAGPRGVMPAKDRVTGWRDALAEADIDTRAAPVRHVVFGRRAGYQAALELFGRPQVDLDAVFVASDEQALGALRAFAELGIRCPDDVAVVSFDGIAAAGYSVPALSTMVQPFADLGRESVTRLLSAGRNHLGANAESVLPVALLRRGSCGCDDPAGGDHSEFEDATGTSTLEQAP